MKNDRPPAYKHRIWWMRNKKSSLPGLIVLYNVTGLEQMLNLTFVDKMHRRFEALVLRTYVAYSYLVIFNELKNGSSE